jgi:glycosidase
MNVLSEDTLVRIKSRLAFLYGEQVVPAIIENLRHILENHRQDYTAITKSRHWDNRDVILITYGDIVQAPGQPPLLTLQKFLYEHLSDAINVVHILPFFPYSSDDGFAVVDFKAVNPELGTWEDIASLAKSFDLMFDLVLNHVSRSSMWFTDFINNVPPGCDYFLEMDPKANLSQVVRPRTSPLLAEIHTYRGLRYVWATFSHDQIDVNYKNPDVLLEFIDILLFYLRQHARIVRLDAVAFLWKEMGTSCIHLPQTHEIIKLIRDLLENVAPGCLLLTETNVPHAENISYFAHGDEAHLVYQFSLPPLLLHAIHAGTTRYLNQWVMDLQPPPKGCNFINFTASHDGIGLRPLESLIPADETKALLNNMRERGGYISFKRNPDGSESPYELNISFFDAFCSPSHQPDNWQIARFLLSQTVPLALQGIPAVYFHSLVATPNDLQGVETTGMTRAINRRKWDKSELEILMGQEDSPTFKVITEYTRRLRIRREQSAFHPDAKQMVLDLGYDLLAVQRTSLDSQEQIIALHNFTPFTKPIAVAELGLSPSNHNQWHNLISGKSRRIVEGTITLNPYEACWFIFKQADRINTD